MTPDEIRALQTLLNDVGCGPVPVSGVYGPETESAYQRYLRDRLPPEAPQIAPPAAKPWWKSRAAWGALAGIVAGLAGLAGYEIDAGAAADALVAVATAIAGVVALIGTIKRKSPIDSRRIAPGLSLDISQGRARVVRDTPSKAQPPDTRK